MNEENINPSTRWRSLDSIPTSKHIEIIDTEILRIHGNKNYTIIKIYTDNGVTGIGETFPLKEQAELLSVYSEKIIGENPLNINQIRAKLPSEGNIGSAAAAGVEMALWDILGKIAGCPLHQLFGGAVRKNVRLYADVHAGHQVSIAPSKKPREVYTPQAYADACEEAVSMGYNILKIDLDVPQVKDKDTTSGHFDRREIKYRKRIIEKVRERIGDSVSVGIDLHRSLTPETVVRLSQEIEQFNILWLEDPVPEGDISSYAQLASDLSIPILSGEMVHNPNQLKRYMEPRKVDMMSIDISKTGVMDFREMENIMTRNTVPLVPGNNTGPFGTFAAVHMASVAQNLIALQHHGYRCDVWDDIAERTGSNLDLVTDGKVRLPKGNGIGLSLTTGNVTVHR